MNITTMLSGNPLFKIFAIVLAVTLSGAFVAFRHTHADPTRSDSSGPNQTQPASQPAPADFRWPASYTRIPLRPSETFTSNQDFSSGLPYWSWSGELPHYRFHTGTKSSAVFDPTDVPLSIRRVQFWFAPRPVTVPGAASPESTLPDPDYLHSDEFWSQQHSHFIGGTKKGIFFSSEDGKFLLQLGPRRKSPPPPPQPPLEHSSQGVTNP
jgi:hypothetical protein